MRKIWPEISPLQQAVFDTGQEVGQLPILIFPSGVLIEENHLHHEETVAFTIKVRQNSALKAINEAAFLYDDVRLRVDKHLQK